MKKFLYIILFLFYCVSLKLFSFCDDDSFNSIWYGDSCDYDSLLGDDSPIEKYFNNKKKIISINEYHNTDEITDDDDDETTDDDEDETTDDEDEIIDDEDENNRHFFSQCNTENNAGHLIMPDKWIVQSAIRNAPQLLKGIFSYLQSHSFRSGNCFSKDRFVTSYHRFILVGPPGSGKTTLAYAIADMLGWKTIFIPATMFLGRYRNETSVNIHDFFRQCFSDNEPKVIIIDELHKLFEHHENEHSDDSQTATAFWQGLDIIEKQNLHAVIIGTANSVKKLPPELKSRFEGKIIIISLPSKKKKIRAFKEIIAHDSSVLLSSNIDDLFIEKIINQISNGSLRNMQLLIDTAKMFYYSENSELCNPIPLTKKHFRLALNQLKYEVLIFNESTLDRVYKKLKKWGLLFSVAVNVIVLMNTSVNMIYNIFSWVS